MGLGWWVFVWGGLEHFASRKEKSNTFRIFGKIEPRGFAYVGHAQSSPPEEECDVGFAKCDVGFAKSVILFSIREVKHVSLAQ